MRNTDTSLPDVQYVRVTPDLARQWLDTMGRQRPLKQGHVRFLADEFLAGNWRQQAEPIKFDTAGRLIDGQHRLTAFLLARKEGYTGEWVQQVARGLEPCVFDTLDTGRVRNWPDVLALLGRRNITTTAGVLRQIYAADEDGMPSTRGLKRLPNEICRQLDAEHGDTLAPIISRVSGMKGLRALLPGELTAAYFVWHMTQREGEPASLVWDFMERLMIGAGEHVDSPIWRLREALLRSYHLSLLDSASGIWERRVLFYMLRRTYRQERAGKRMKMFRVYRYEVGLE